MSMTRWHLGRFLRTLLIVPISVTLVLPSPAFALRQLNAGMEESPVNLELHERFGRATGLEESRRRPDSATVERLRAYVVGLGARLDESSLKMPHEPEPVLAPTGPEGVMREPIETFQARMLQKVQQLARTLQQPIGLHVIPSWDFPGILEQDFHGHAIFVVPDVLRDAGVADDAQAAREFLGLFEYTMLDKWGYGRRSRQRDPGTPSVPIVLFIRRGVADRAMLHDQYFVFDDVDLFPKNAEHFQKRLVGIYHWRFEDLDGQSQEFVRRRLLEDYLDKLLALATPAAGLEERSHEALVRAAAAGMEAFQAGDRIVLQGEGAGIVDAVGTRDNRPTITIRFDETPGAPKTYYLQPLQGRLVHEREAPPKRPWSQLDISELLERTESIMNNEAPDPAELWEGLYWAATWFATTFNPNDPSWSSGLSRFVNVLVRATLDVPPPSRVNIGKVLEMLPVNWAGLAASRAAPEKYRAWLRGLVDEALASRRLPFNPSLQTARLAQGKAVVWRPWSTLSGVEHFQAVFPQWELEVSVFDSVVVASVGSRAQAGYTLEGLARHVLHSHPNQEFFMESEKDARNASRRAAFGTGSSIIQLRPGHERAHLLVYDPARSAYQLYRGERAVTEQLRKAGVLAPRGGLEERETAVARDLAGAAWRGVPPMAGLGAQIGSAVLVFRDQPDLAALAVQQGLAVVYDADTPEAAGLEELLGRLPGPKRPYAIGTQASARFLQNYPEATRIPITDRRQFFALVGLEEDGLPAPVRQALTATRNFLDLAA